MKILPENNMNTIFSNPSKVNRKKRPGFHKLKVPGVSTEGSSGRRKFQTHLANIAPNLPICYILSHDSDELTDEMTYAALQPIQPKTDELILQDKTDIWNYIN